MLAKHLGLSQPFVSQMSTGKKSIPVAHMYRIEQFTGGAVTRRDMHPVSPELIWPDLAHQLNQQPQPTTAARQASGAGVSNEVAYACKS